MASTDAFLTQIRDKFVDAADWPNDVRVDLCERVTELVAQLADGTIARGKRTGAIKVSTPPKAEPVKASDKADDKADDKAEKE